jgi:hypothetical protein
MRMDSTNRPTQPELGGLHKIMRLYLFTVHPIPSTSTGWMSLCYEVMNGESAENGQLLRVETSNDLRLLQHSAGGRTGQTVR